LKERMDGGQGRVRERETVNDGAFMPDGSWARGKPHGPAHHAVVDLARRFEREQITPQAAAGMVRGLAYRVEREPELAIWDILDKREKWPCAHTSTSAGEFIKRAACRGIGHRHDA